MTRYRAFTPTDPISGTIDDLALVEDTDRDRLIVAQHEGPDALTHAEETARALNRLVPVATVATPEPTAYATAHGLTTLAWQVATLSAIALDMIGGVPLDAYGESFRHVNARARAVASSQ